MFKPMNELLISITFPVGKILQLPIIQRFIIVKHGRVMT